MLSEISQTEKDKQFMISHVESKNTATGYNNKAAHRYIEQTNSYQLGEESRRKAWGTGKRGANYYV